MPSYKDKFETISRTMEDIEQRVLIDSAVLRSLKNEIDSLKRLQLSAETRTVRALD
jgi:hypothetical protein